MLDLFVKSVRPYMTALDGALTSPRVAPAMIGLGLLEAVPQSTLEALADPGDADHDGIAGSDLVAVGYQAANRFNLALPLYGPPDLSTA